MGVDGVGILSLTVRYGTVLERSAVAIEVFVALYCFLLLIFAALKVR